VFGIGNSRQSPLGKDPALIAKRGDDFAAVVFDFQLRVLSWQQDVMIELRDNLAQIRSNEQKIDDQVIFVQGAAKLGGHAVVVAVQSLARISKCDEVGRAEYVLGFLDANVIGFGHLRNKLPTAIPRVACSRGTGTMRSMVA
jgi:hypothetical protein